MPTRIALVLSLAVVAGAQAQEVSAARGWMFNESTLLPSAMHAEVLSRVTFASGGSLTRPFASNLGAAGTLVEVGGELGVLPAVSVVMLGAQGDAPVTRATATGAQVGLRWAALARNGARLVIGAGYLRDLSGSNGAWSRVSFEQDIGRARLALSLHGEHLFSAGHDGFDVMVRAGADAPVVGPLRAGVEYVGQDLEGIAQVEAEGGARHIVGGVLGVRLLSNSLSLTGGPALGIGAGTARAMGRFALAVAF